MYIDVFPRFAAVLDIVASGDCLSLERRDRAFLVKVCWGSFFGTLILSKAFMCPCRFALQKKWEPVADNYLIHAQECTLKASIRKPHGCLDTIGAVVADIFEFCIF